MGVSVCQCVSMCVCVHGPLLFLLQVQKQSSGRLIFGHVQSKEINNKQYTHQDKFDYLASTMSPDLGGLVGADLRWNLWMDFFGYLAVNLNST